MQKRDNAGEVTGRVFSIQRFSVHDGPGIRTVVFLKGCPLSCLWCSNPESQKYEPEILFRADRCINCGECLRTCPENAAETGQQGNVADILKSCSRCMECVKACSSMALSLVGNDMTAEEVCEEINKDRLFYKNSGGGVTLSGGEPLMQPQFAREILKLSKSAGFKTCIETSGYAAWSAFEAVLPHLDLIMFDIKHMDETEHIRLTGVSNKLIQENLEKLVPLHVNVRLRFPLIPGCNDSDGNIGKTAAKALSLGIKKLDLLPYHEYGKSKYAGLMREYKMEQKPFGDEKVESLKRKLEYYGLDIQIGG